MNTRLYLSAVDRWFFPLLVLFPWAVIAVAVWLAAGSLHGLWVGLIVSGMVFLSVRPFISPCQYELSDEALRIQSGFLKITIPVNEVERAELVRSYWAAPCLSVDRVLVVAGNSVEMVSPVDRQSFIADLMTRVEQSKTRPNKSIQPTATAVMPPAAQEPRQP